MVKSLLNTVKRQNIKLGLEKGKNSFSLEHRRVEAQMRELQKTRRERFGVSDPFHLHQSMPPRRSV